MDDDYHEFKDVELLPCERGKIIQVQLKKLEEKLSTKAIIDMIDKEDVFCCWAKKGRWKSRMKTKFPCTSERLEVVDFF